MATASRTTTTYPTNATGTSNFRSSYTTPLRAAFTAGQTITAASMQLLKSAIDTFNGHTHSVIDYAAIAEFGNNGPRTVIAANPRVSAAMSSSVTGTTVASGNTITASIFNSYRNAANATRNHTHKIDDNDYA
jgi:hypothetical protein